MSKEFARRKKRDPWYEKEREACNILNMFHIGGPGKPDCVGKQNPRVKAEVKDYSRTLHSGDVNRIRNDKKYQDGTDKLIIVAINNASENAKKMAEDDPTLEVIDNFRDIIENIDPSKEIGTSKVCVCEQEEENWEERAKKENIK